jgi:hypothetical protein
MPGVLSDEGIDVCNSLLAAALAVGGGQVGLYTNDHVPKRADTLAAYVEASFGGYVRQALASPTDAGTSASINRQNYAPVYFTPTGAGLPLYVFGYFVVFGVNYIGAERFPVPLWLFGVGTAIKVVPALTYQDRSLP